MAPKEYKSAQAFSGVIGRTFDVSRPAWPAPVRARAGAPNVLFIVLDDVGFGQPGCYGSPISTPNLDALAADGLRYSSMHTNELCSSSRACVLTGRNHHADGMACMTKGATACRCGKGSIPFENGMLSEILLQNGYNTYAIGNWQLMPAEAASAAGPYDCCPLGRGFERHYGFLGDDTHQYYPELVREHGRRAPENATEEGDHLMHDLVARASSMIADGKQLVTDKPFFMYCCTGDVHTQHHIPQEWARRYKGRFDTGWDAYREQVFAKQKSLGILPADTRLRRRDADVPDWSQLPENEQRVYARMMEVSAGFLEHTDHGIGELIGFLKATGEYENTLIMVISDNGAGRPKDFNHYRGDWANSGSAPLKDWVRETCHGGTSGPFIVCWPKGIKARGEIRSRCCHAIDMVPTVLDALGIEPPVQIRGVTQSPLQGASLKPSFEDTKAAALHITRLLRSVRPQLGLSRRLARRLPVGWHLVHRPG